MKSSVEWSCVSSLSLPGLDPDPFSQRLWRRPTTSPSAALASWPTRERNISAISSPPAARWASSLSSAPSGGAVADLVGLRQEHAGTTITNGQALHPRRTPRLCLPLSPRSASRLPREGRPGGAALRGRRTPPPSSRGRVQPIDTGLDFSWPAARSVS